MAEAFLNRSGGDGVHGWSAGSCRLGEIAWGTSLVMREKGISLEGQWSKGLNDVPLADMDVIVTMGCEVSCPAPAGFAGRVVEWSIPDPYGSDRAAYREARDLVEAKVTALATELGRSVPKTVSRKGGSGSIRSLGQAEEFHARQSGSSRR